MHHPRILPGSTRSFSFAAGFNTGRGMITPRCLQEFVPATIRSDWLAWTSRLTRHNLILERVFWFVKGWMARMWRALFRAPAPGRVSKTPLQGGCWPVCGVFGQVDGVRG